MDKMDEKFICRLYASYCVTANYGRPVDEEGQIPADEKVDRSTNALNCRKTSMIGKLFIIYKLTSKGFSKDLGKLYEELLTPYATQYLELVSVVTDLNFYVPFLSEG